MQFERQPLEGPVEAFVLAGDSADAFNDIEHPNRVAPEKKKVTLTDGVAELPPHSLTILKWTRSAGRQ